MSISLGIYDFFAYIIPGMLYLFTFNEFLRAVGLRFIDLSLWFQSGQGPNIIFVIPILIAAYLAGHILDPLAYYFYCEFIYSLRHKRKIYDKQLQYMKERYPSLDIQFKPREWNIMFTFLRQRNIEISKILDKYQADSIMLRNIAFSTLVLTIIYIVLFFTTGTWMFLLTALGTLLISFMAINKSNQFRTWFYTGIFEASVEYGTTLQEVATFTTRKSNLQNRRLPKRK